LQLTEPRFSRDGSLFHNPARSKLHPRDGQSTCDNIYVIVVIMIRTQISLSRKEYKLARQEASRLGISLAELLRRSLRPLLPVDQTRPWMRFIGFVESGDPESSRKIDELVYGIKN
jgi:hypothetical protein